MQHRKKRKVEVTLVPEGVGGSLFGDMVKVPDRLTSRVLYANPVCMLVSEQGGAYNVMTISWLSCVSNDGVVMFSMNEGRQSAELLFKEGYAGRFTLCVPVQGAETLLRRIGGESGRDVDKFSTLGMTLCPVGAPGEPLASADIPAAIDHPLVVAHLDCTILSGNHDHRHHIFIAKIASAHVRSRYWSGDTFQPTDPALPPYLTFFGSGRFGGAAPLAPSIPTAPEAKTGDTDKLVEENKKLRDQVANLKREVRALRKTQGEGVQGEGVE